MSISSNTLKALSQKRERTCNPPDECPHLEVVHSRPPELAWNSCSPSRRSWPRRTLSSRTRAPLSRRSSSPRTLYHAPQPNPSTAHQRTGAERSFGGAGRGSEQFTLKEKLRKRKRERTGQRLGLGQKGGREKNISLQTRTGTKGGNRKTDMRTHELDEKPGPAEGWPTYNVWWNASSGRTRTHASATARGHERHLCGVSVLLLKRYRRRHTQVIFVAETGCQRPLSYSNLEKTQSRRDMSGEK